MKNNKGFTVVELLASFSLTMVIVVFLFEILLEIKDLYYEAGIKTEVLQRQTMLVSKIRNSLDTSELTGVNCSGNSCTLTFADNDPMLLEINSTNNTITYGDSKYSFPEDVEFSEYGVDICETEIVDGVTKPKNTLGGDGIVAKNCFFDLNITISSPELDKEYPVNIVYPFNYNPTFVMSEGFEPDSSTVGSSNWYTCSNNYQTYEVLESGTYKIQLLGASGGTSDNGKLAGGLGAYTSGEIYLEKNEKLYFYVGCAGSKIEGGATASYSGGYNGGGSGSNTGTGITYSGGGGGATDVRLSSGTWNNAASLKSRIMVAAGGSGAGNGSDAKAGTPGGSLIASNSNETDGPKGSTQTTGGKTVSGGNVGTFGKGADANTLGSGGGGGYYGGTGGVALSNTGTSGTGGSSFISGHFGANAIDSAGNHTGQSVHYSGKLFYNTEIYSGDDVPLEHTSNTFSQTHGGDEGDGYAIITHISSSIPDEARKVSASRASYPQGINLWLDGHDNSGYGYHKNDISTWYNQGNIKADANMTLTTTKWRKDGIDLSSKGNLDMHINKAFTLSTAFTLEAYPPGTTNLLAGDIELNINSAGKVGFKYGSSSITFDYSIKNLNIKEYLTVVGTGTEVILYANGEEVSRKNLTSNTIENAEISITGNLSGTLHKIMVFASNLEKSDVAVMYQEDDNRYGPSNNIVDDIKLLYNFSDENYEYEDEETRAKMVTDFSGNKNDAKIIGENNFDETNKGFVLDGSANYLEIPGNINYRYTVSLVVSATNKSGTNPSLIGSSTYPSLYLNSSNSYKYAFNAQGINTAFTQEFTTNKKEYITLTYDGSRINLYIDGTLKNSLTTTTDPKSVTSAYLGKTFKGNIYKYAVYDRVLLTEEIKALYEYDYDLFK